MAANVTPSPATPRFEKKREAIVAAATEVLNAQGVRGMTLAEIANLVGLNTTSITYYFRRKEDLAVACFLAGIERMNAMIADAASAPDLAARVCRLFDLHLARILARRRGEGPPFVAFKDIRSLEEPHLSVVLEAFGAMVRNARALVTIAGRDRRQIAACAELMLEQVFWSSAWLVNYDDEDTPRARDRALDILLYGFAREGAPGPARNLTGADDVELSARETFLKACTRLLNRLGYRGASVDKISAELNVTKGSFYHHNEAKDEMVAACFARSDALTRTIQNEAMARAGTGWERLSAAVSSLLDTQGSPRGPLLRTSALIAVPEGMRSALIEQSARTTMRFAAIVADAVADGSIRPVDPVIAAHLLRIAINTGSDFDQRVRGATRDDVFPLLGRPILYGLAGE